MFTGVGFTLFAADREVNRTWHDTLPEPEEIESEYREALGEMGGAFDRIVTYVRRKGRGRMETHYSYEETREPIKEWLIESWNLNAMASKDGGFSFPGSLF